jgi:carbon-monoxide dehydrogenase small subunit
LPLPYLRRPPDAAAPTSVRANERQAIILDPRRLRGSDWHGSKVEIRENVTILALKAAHGREPSCKHDVLRESEEALMAAVSLTVNGKSVTVDVDPRTLLVQLLRENLRLTGTHVGCDTSQCGACVVLVNGKAVKSCTVLALQLQGADVLSIEGLAPADGPLHPMQEAFRENHGLQCGYCTPGMILTAVDMVRRKGHELDDKTIREELEGNICRCTGYHNIVKAIAAGARAMDGGAAKKAAE